MPADKENNDHKYLPNTEIHIWHTKGLNCDSKPEQKPDKLLYRARAIHTQAVIHEPKPMSVAGRPFKQKNAYFANRKKMGRGHHRNSFQNEKVHYLFFWELV